MQTFGEKIIAGFFVGRLPNVSIKLENGTVSISARLHDGSTRTAKIKMLGLAWRERSHILFRLGAAAQQTTNY